MVREIPKSNSDSSATSTIKSGPEANSKSSTQAGDATKRGGSIQTTKGSVGGNTGSSRITSASKSGVSIDSQSMSPAKKPSKTFINTGESER